LGAPHDGFSCGVFGIVQADKAFQVFDFGFSVYQTTFAAKKYFPSGTPRAEVAHGVFDSFLSSRKYLYATRIISRQKLFRQFPKPCTDQKVSFPLTPRTLPRTIRSIDLLRSGAISFNLK
jgi:hypothetical protein